MASSARIGADLKVDGNLYLPNIPVLNSIHEEYILLTNAEGLTEKAGIEALTTIPYSKHCSAANGIVPSPTWANGPNKLFSECPEVLVGIGTNTPTRQLDVRGDIKSTGHLWANTSISIGADMNTFSKLSILSLHDYTTNFRLSQSPACQRDVCQSNVD
jgi:hypothetical protein